MWTDAAIFIGFFGGMFVLRIIVATIVFFWILPEGDQCPLCNAHTLRVQSRFWNGCLPWLRTSWCFECDWHGLLRPSPAPRASASKSPSPSRSARVRQ